MSRLRTWWTQPDPFDWITSFLRQRRLLRSAQLIMGVVTTSSALVPLSVLASGRPTINESLVWGAVTAVFTAGVTALWLTRWPTRRQSELVCVVGALSTAAWSLTQPNPTLTALGGAGMAVIAGYIAFFHTTRLLLVNFVLALMIAVAAAVRLGRDAGLVTAMGAFWLIWFLNVSVSIGVWAMSRALVRYAARSDEDPLTGLLNRRGFIDTLDRQLAAMQATGNRLSLLMIDLDDFKRINDTDGHAAGDTVLIAVSDLLRSHAPPGAAICRAGGEEFLIADISTGCDVSMLATNLCAAIAALPQRITASIGSTTAEITDADASTRHIEHLIAVADAAMYAAKRDGGNRPRHTYATIC
ncbi:GGDEF domain-containing protein [Mycobacterium sp. NPDC050551]|uniref:GGDEF domain-containing protein n=1 Tax=Mycobacterium sp. NPDC050551 TaxID=3155407 RepID=UPI0034175C20